VNTSSSVLEAQNPNLSSAISWDTLAEIFIENHNYDFPKSIPKEMLTLANGTKGARIDLTHNQILGPAFEMPRQFKDEFTTYYFMVALKIKNSFQQFEVVFGIHKETRNIFVFAIRKPTPFFLNNYFKDVEAHNLAMMGTEEAEYYTIKGFFKGIKTLKVSPATEYKIKSRHNLELYDVVEPLHVGRIRSEFQPNISKGFLMENTRTVFVKTDLGDTIKIVLEVIVENGEKIFLLKTAFAVE
jgi:hypothetical protein